jgi:hypothetical protein
MDNRAPKEILSKEKVKPALRVIVTLLTEPPHWLHGGNEFDFRVFRDKWEIGHGEEIRDQPPAVEIPSSRCRRNFVS